jgi:hypothetical protein
VSRDGSAGATGWGWDERRRAQIARGAWCADPARAEDCSRLLPSGSAIGLGYHHDRVNTGGNKAFFFVCVCVVVVLMRLVYGYAVTPVVVGEQLVFNRSAQSFGS